MRYPMLSAAAFIALGFSLAACSQETQDNAARTADQAAQDSAQNLDAAGKQLEEGAADAAREVSQGAARIENELRNRDEPATGSEAPSATPRSSKGSENQQDLEEEHYHDPDEDEQEGQPPQR